LTRPAADIVDEPDAPADRPGAGAADSESLVRSAGRGALYQLLGGGAQSIINLGATAVLARLLSTEDFGIMGMAALARGLIARAGTLETGGAVIAKRDLNQDDLSTAFWMRAGVLGVLCVVTLVSAPLIAEFFHTPQLTWVMRAVAAIFVFTAASSVPGALLRRNLRFGVVKIIQVGGFALQYGGTILLVVLFDLRYWALVLGLLISSLCTCIATVVCARWRPSLRFSRESFRFIFPYAINGMGASLVSYLHTNIDHLLVGRILGAASMGLYSLATRIPRMVIVRVAGPVGAVLFPTLAKAQETDERLAAGYTKICRYIALIVFPLLGGLAAVAKPAVAVWLSAKWLPAVVPLQIVCIRTALVSIFRPLGSLFLCKNRPDVPFKFSLCTLAFTFAAVAMLGYAFGLVGVAWGMLVSLAPHFVLLWYAFRMLGVPLRRFFRAMAPPTISATVSSASALVVALPLETLGMPMPIVLAVSVAAGVLGYVATMVVLFRETLRDVGQTIRIVLGRKPPARREAPPPGEGSAESR